MTRGSMTASVSMARAMLILSACLVLGTLIGLLPHSAGASSGQNLRSAPSAQPLQQEQKTTRDAGISRAKLPDASLLGRSGWRAADEKEESVQEVNDYVWSGNFAAIQEHELDTEELSMSFSFEFGGSLSYDYYY